MFNRPVKIVVDQLIYDLQNRPRDFDCRDASIRDKEAQITYYLGQTVCDVGVDSPFKMDFGCIQGWRLHTALKKWKAWKILDKTNRLG